MISHLMIVRTWAKYAIQKNQFLSATHLDDIANWSDEAVEMLYEQGNDLRIMFNRCKATARLLTSGGACKMCHLREKCDESE